MTLRPLCLTSLLALTVAMPAQADMVFNRISAFATPMNAADAEDAAKPSSAEIIAATEDGMTLIYSDSPKGVLGLIDITDARAPKPLGQIDMGGEPTTTKVLGGLAFAGVNTSETFTNPSGKLVTVDLATKAVAAECDLGGQPDSVARAKDVMGGDVVTSGIPAQDARAAEQAETQRKAKAQMETMRSVQPRSAPTQPMSTLIMSWVSAGTTLPPCPTSSYTVNSRETLRASVTSPATTARARPRRIEAESLSSKKRLLR